MATAPKKTDAAEFASQADMAAPEGFHYQVVDATAAGGGDWESIGNGKVRRLVKNPEPGPKPE